ncbi:YdeI family protein [uncultured Jatrophihabitans sp.]|uniref:YdeI/OmpD-associated family protein n=1 Tax=uncultured Jatrophihabitans sp. TaxID=1610747 RepID=UPI0035CBE932
MGRRRGTSPGTPGGTPDRPALFFADAAEFRDWLAGNHDTATELWMGLYKKHVAARGLTWAEAVPEALCFGWIDSRVERIDADAIRQRWTPRKPTSTWSAVNVAHVERLVGEGRMHPAGLTAFERRRAERTAIYVYERAEDAELPPEYAQLLAADARATRFLEIATPSYRKHVTSWVVSAKQQATRDRRMAQLIDDSAAGRLIPSQRFGREPSWVARAREAIGDRE